MLLHYLDVIFNSIYSSDFLWIIIPIFFIGIITDKYQEEFETSVGNAITNGTLIIFTGFSWLELISSRVQFPADATISQTVFSLIIIIYGFAIIISGFRKGEFARVYGRIRVITFMLIFFTMMIYVPLLYNFFSIVLFVFLFPFYYAFITELLKILPRIRIHKNFPNDKHPIKKPKDKPIKKSSLKEDGLEKIKEYLK